jgi:uncharacterized protein
VAAIALQQLTAYLIQEIPRREDPGAGDGADSGTAQRAQDPGRSQRLAALLAAYHAGIAAPENGGTVAFGWFRTAAGGPVRVIAAGDALVGSAGGSVGGNPAEVMLALPAGARGTELSPADLEALASGLRWREITVISDGLLCGDQDRQAQQPAGLSLDDGLLGSWDGAFGWLVVAEPADPCAVAALAKETAAAQHAADRDADRFPERAVTAQRLKARHGELLRGTSGGFWRITVLAGGADEASAARVAGLFCAATDLRGLPYALSPVPAPAAEPVPCFASTELLAALVRPPEKEVPGVRFALRPDFDVTPENQETGITLGDVLDRNLRRAGPLRLSTNSLNRHVFVCGATGAGKSQTVRCLLEAATEHGIPWLVVEPAKAEYRLMASRLPGTEVIRIRPGEPDAIAAGLNPLEPATDPAGVRFPLQTHADLVKALFIASFQAEEPFPQVLSAALSRVYTAAGWDLALGEPRYGRAEAAFPTLRDLEQEAERVVTDIGYSQRVTDDVLGFIRVRIASLRQGTTGRFLEGGHPLDFTALLNGNVVLEIEDVGDDADKAFLMGTVLIRLVEHLRLTHRAGGGGPRLKHLTVIEEAHRLLRRTESDKSGGGAASHAVELFAGLLAEIRAYGEGLIIAEQIPARLLADAIKNTAVKITHRLPAADDREAVGATMNATPPQSRYLVTLPPGQAAVFADGMDFPVLVQIQDGTERELVTHGTTSDARSVVRPRSGTCGTECAARPCKLRELRHGEQILDDLPWIRQWADLAVLAHLTGWPMPVPTPQALSALRARPLRLTQCALSQAIDKAVAAPASTASAEIARPGALAVHVAAAINARIADGAWQCEPDEPQWLLTPQAAQALEVSGALDGLPDTFIDCQWPHLYAAAG